MFHLDTDDQQCVPINDMESSIVSTMFDDESITTSQEYQVANAFVSLDDCFDCHVELSRCQVKNETLLYHQQEMEY